MKIAYRKKETGIEIVRIWGTNGIIQIPEEIEGQAVTEIAPYTFSNHKWKEESQVLWTDIESDDFFFQEEELICGAKVQKVVIPDTVRAIGNYAFYGCVNLEELYVTDQIVRMGSGIFTGCRLRKIDIRFLEGKKSCLKEVLTEIRFEVTAVLHYKEGTKVQVLFPEHYLDAVENTPARIVETHYYGSGGEYRECFYRKELDYAKYDQVFLLSDVRDEEEVTMKVALYRLMYPYELGAKAEQTYKEYLKERVVKLILNWLDQAEVKEVIYFCKEKGLFEAESLNQILEVVDSSLQPEAFSILMDIRQEFFPKKRKVFEL